MKPNHDDSSGDSDVPEAKSAQTKARLSASKDPPAAGDTSELSERETSPRLTEGDPPSEDSAGTIIVDSAETTSSIPPDHEPSNILSASDHDDSEGSNEEQATFIGEADAEESSESTETIIGPSTDEFEESADQQSLETFITENGEGPSSRTVISDEELQQSQAKRLKNISIPGYEILAEIGRGGMGVVYRANHQALSRIVALKMILAGGHASRDHLARFRTEAEAVAHLQHPNIIQVFDVGVHNGLPFFSLEFLPGGSLEDVIDGQPQAEKKAAETVALLARAMGHAHEHGILHRDLKPANILMSVHGEPKITDFGLAKRLEEEDGQTRTGTIMGTPSYMSPEQARGQKDIGPAADIYSLGAILYEMITGRPPFMGSKPMKTLMQVLQQEPVPPSRLQPGVSKDLETICLKCLQKDPQKRYLTSDELADDLQRFVQGQPILARPVSRAEQLWRWCRRNPRIAVPTVLAALLSLTVMIGGPAAAVIINNRKNLEIEARKEAEINRLKAVAEKDRADLNAKTAHENEEKAIENEQKAVAQKNRADQNAKSAAEQRSLALNALGTLVTEVQEKLADTPATQDLKQNLLNTALNGLRQVAESANDSAIVDGRMAQAHQRMGQVFETLGQLQDAKEQYQKMHEIIKAMFASSSDTIRAKRNLAVTHTKLGDVSLLLGETEEARHHYREALAKRQSIHDASPGSLRAKVDLAQSTMNMGLISSPEEACDYYSAAVAQRREILTLAAKEDYARRQRDLWTSLIHLGETYLRLGSPELARPLFEEAVEIANALSNGGFQAQQDLAGSHEFLGKALKSTDPQAASERFRTAAELFRPLAEADSRNLPLQARYAIALARVGARLEAIRVAETILEQAADDYRYIYNAACVYAICHGFDANDDSTADESRALELLEKSVECGFDDADFLSIDADLESIRSHPRFSEVLNQLRTKSVQQPVNGQVD